MSEKNKEKPITSIVSIVFAMVLIIGSVGWLISNVGEAWGWVFDRDDPVPTETPVPPDDGVEAVLYAECQEQLRDALEGVGPVPSDTDKEANAEYLAEARAVHIRLRDLVDVGRILLYEINLADDEGRIDDEFREEWRETAYQYRTDLYRAIEKYRDMGVGDQFVRIHSELFVAYQYVDLFSDQVNSYYVKDGVINSIESFGLNRAEAHLDTAGELLNR